MQRASLPRTLPPPNGSVGLPAEDDPVLALLRQRGLLADDPSQAQDPTTRPRDPAANAVIAAMAFLDLPYVYGGSSADSGFDCSGFTHYIYRHTLGVQLPRTAEQQALDRNLVEVELDALAPGDLVFFNTAQRRFSHVGIYIGNQRFVHSPRTGAAVRLENMQAGYWAQRFDGGRRAQSALALLPAPRTQQPNAAQSPHG